MTPLEVFGIKIYINFYATATGQNKIKGLLFYDKNLRCQKTDF
jgi:hypothetical protein